MDSRILFKSLKVFGNEPYQRLTLPVGHYYLGKVTINAIPP